MASQALLQVDGTRELRRTLTAVAKALPGDDGAKGGYANDLKAAYRSVGNIIVPASVTNAPKRSGRLAGTLRASGTKTTAVVRVGKSSVPYAGPIHYGWPARNIKANPFVIDAGRATEPRWVAAFQAGLDKLLARVKGA